MQTDIFGSLEVRGWEVPVMGSADCQYDDRSFDHEFGTYEDGSWEVEDITDVRIDGCDLALARHCLSGLGFARRRRANRRLARAFALAVAAQGERCFTALEMDLARHQAAADADASN